MNFLEQFGIARTTGGYVLTLKSDEQISLEKHDKLSFMLSEKQLNDLLFNGETLLQDTYYAKHPPEEK